MLPRLTRQDDEEQWEVEYRYGKPQHETGPSASEQELYGEPQHDVTERAFPSDFDPDFAFALHWFDLPGKRAANVERQSVTER
jgi:hypothetical protein